MKILVIGAGATVAEAKNLGAEEDNLPPLMSNFAQHMWSNTAPCQYHLKKFLASRGHVVESDDGRNEFYALEKSDDVNIEQLLEFCWQNRKIQYDLPDSLEELPKGYISGFRVTYPGDNSIGSDDESMRFWNDILYHGIAMPLVIKMDKCFFVRKKSGKVCKELSLSKQLISYLRPGDIVLNLNYDTVFELALDQSGKNFTYAPNHSASFYTAAPNYGNVRYTVKFLDQIIVCKPHGSLNLRFFDGSLTTFKFLDPKHLYPGGAYLGLIPPRLEKTYEQHPFARIVLESIKGAEASEIVFWGVGLTQSDDDLVDLYRGWLKPNTIIKVIDPKSEVCERAKKLLSIKDENIEHFKNVNEWAEKQE